MTEPWPAWSPRCEPDSEAPLDSCDVFTVAACATLWLSGWEATCEEDFASNGVAFTGATDPATVAALATGALAPDATFPTPGPALDNDGPFANDAAGAEGAAPIGLAEAL
jgi:hypothetical protein